MSTSADTVEAFLAAFRLRDVDAAMSTVSDELTLTVHPLRLNGGKDDLRSLVSSFATAFPDLLVTVSHLIDLGEVVVAEFKIEGTQAADFLDAINQEKHLDLDTAWRFTVADDQIVGLQAYWCQNQLYRRLAVKRQDHVAIV